MSFKASSPKTPCPICGRTSVGCRVDGELLFCRIGNSCSPLTKHPNLKTGAVVADGWACVSINEEAECASFKVHEEPVEIGRTRYDYFTTHGDRIAKTRVDYSNGKKEFKSPKYKLDELLPLYYELLEGVEPGTSVYVLEGEKAAAAMRERGFDAIGLPGTTYQPRELPLLRDKQLIWCPDRDRVGVELMQRWADHYGGGLWLLAEPKNRTAWRDPSDGYDAADWLPDVEDVAEVTGAVTDKAPELPVAPWWERIPPQLTDKGKPIKPSASELVDILQQHIGRSLTYNDLTKRAEIDGEALDDENMSGAYINLQRVKIFVSDKTATDSIIHACRDNSYNPIRDYFDTCNNPLSQDDWDHIADRTLGDTYSRAHNIAMQRWFVGGVACMYEPGAIPHHGPVVVGEQNSGKSKTPEELLPDLLKKYFKGGFDFIPNDKDRLIEMHEHFVVEFGEMESNFNRNTLGQFKAFLTKEVDNIRKPYGRFGNRWKRQQIFWGTSNKSDGLLIDPTGNRRFVVYEIDPDKRVNLPWTITNRDRIWSSAVAAYRSGFSRMLTPEEVREIGKANDEHLVSDPWEAKLSEHLEENPVGDITTGHLSSELLRILGVETGRQEQSHLQRLAVQMKKAGWIGRRSTVGGVRGTRWWKP